MSEYRKLVEALPWLTANGVCMPGRPDFGGDMYLRHREEPEQYEEAFQRCLLFMKECCYGTRYAPRRATSSYGWKHVVEHWSRIRAGSPRRLGEPNVYVPNGVFIAACIYRNTPFINAYGSPNVVPFIGLHDSVKRSWRKPPTGHPVYLA